MSNPPPSGRRIKIPYLYSEATPTSHSSVGTHGRPTKGRLSFFTYFSRSCFLAYLTPSSSSSPHGYGPRLIRERPRGPIALVGANQWALRGISYHHSRKETPAPKQYVSSLYRRYIEVGPGSDWAGGEGTYVEFVNEPTNGGGIAGEIFWLGSHRLEER